MWRFSTYLVQFERLRPDVVILFCAVGASVVEKGVMAWYAHFRGSNAFMLPRAGAASYGSRFTRSWVRVAFGGVRKILCQGPALQRLAISLLGFRPEDAPIIPNWTATPALLSIGRQRSFNTGDRPVRLLFLGWLEREKGAFELIEACRQLSESRRFVLDIVGEGKASASLRELVVRYGLGETVRFRGWLKGADVESALAEADVLVLPSWAEGLPNAMVEAMAARLAVVVSAVGNIPEVVTDGREALLVPPRNVSALKAALARVIDDPVLRRHLGDAAFTLAASQWGVEQAVEGMLLAIDSLQP
jgi:glycosyltransferase involved in cell wall biosynthesis